jgi:hypothetical protein
MLFTKYVDNLVSSIGDIKCFCDPRGRGGAYQTHVDRPARRMSNRPPAPNHGHNYKYDCRRIPRGSGGSHADDRPGVEIVIHAQSGPSWFRKTGNNYS